MSDKSKAPGKAKVTKRLVEALPVEKGRRSIVWDENVNGFGVRATGAGRTYFVRYRAGTGRTALRRDYTIGKHGAPWTVEKAREEAKRILGRVAAGEDPQAEKVANRKPDEERTFEAVARKFIQRHVEKNLKSSTSREYRRIINGTLVPAWGEKRVDAIERRDVRELVDNIEEHAPALARFVFAVTRKLFNYALDRDLIAENPCSSMSGPPLPKARDRVLSDDELRLVWKGAGKLGFPYGHAVRALVLTAQRRSEVSTMERADVDLTRSEWIIPGQKAKNAKAHAVDLSPEMVKVIEAAEDALRPKPSAKPVGSFVFGVTGENPPTQWGRYKRLLDEAIAEIAKEEGFEPPAPWRLHDLRRTAATGMAGLGFGPHIIERVLNHISGAQGGLVGVYQRHEYREERRAALLAWARKVGSLVAEHSDEVVVEFSRNKQMPV